MTLRRPLLLAGLVLGPLLLLALAVASWLFIAQGGFAPFRVPESGTKIASTDPATIEHGEYLARLGNCATCHTVRGGTPYAGGRGFRTGYGTVYATNLTPHASGIGDWSIEEFRHAMRHGVSRNGVLSPVFPYAHFARLTDADLDALFAYLRSLPPSDARRVANRLDFPASSPFGLIGWRMLYHRPGANGASLPSGASEEIARGRYLVDGLGHCAMCHGARGRHGSLPAAGYLAGGRVPGIGWYAPPIDATQLARYDVDSLARFLKHGASEQGHAYGPMAEVVYASLRHLTDEDARAMAAYLKQIPEHRRAPPMGVASRPGPNGARLYEAHCSECHGADGKGQGLDYPPLRGAVSVTAPDPVNAIRLILYGGVAPTTAGHPRPHSMPPFVQRLTSEEVAAVVNYVRGTWGAGATPVGARDVEAMHGVVLD